jgi:hypothetical protein
MTAFASSPSAHHPPDLTLPSAEAAAVAEAYASANIILEYGSGGSTVIAAEMDGKTIFSVESDASWVAGFQSWFAANKPKATVHLHVVDIGQTAEWGAPVSQRGWRRYHHYPISVWDRDDFVHPDVVLIDGRFRLACFLTTLYRITRPITVLFDDYRNRPVYHRVETLVQPSTLIGRMARFDLVPRTLAPENMAMFVDAFSRPA